MEDEKLAAYYDELTRKGGGAARFKQGLGFSSSSSDAVPSRGYALPTTTSSSSFLSSFVRSSSPSKRDQFEKQAQLQSIQNKLTKKPQPKTLNPTRKRSRSRSPSRNSSRRRSRSRDRYSRRRRSRSRSRDSYSRPRSRSRDRSHRHSPERRSRHNYRSRSRSKEKNRERRKREESPEERRREKGKKVNGGGTDFAKLIDGYEHMAPAERVKAKMKLQLSKTAENDEAIGKGSGWERFDFDKDAPLDDEEIEAVEDDAALVKHIGQSFRFSAVEARKEEEIKAAHDEAMFGASSHPPPTKSDDEAEEESYVKQNVESAPVTNLLSNQILTMQKGSWRDRARKT